MSILWSVENPFSRVNETLRRLRLDSGMVIEDVAYHGDIARTEIGDLLYPVQIKRRVIKSIEDGRRTVTVDFLRIYSKVFEMQISDILRKHIGLEPETRKFMFIEKLLLHETLGCIRVGRRTTYERLAHEFGCKARYIKRLEDIGNYRYLENQIKAYSDYFDIPVWKIFQISEHTRDLDTKEAMVINYDIRNFIVKGV